MMICIIANLLQWQSCPTVGHSLSQTDIATQGNSSPTTEYVLGIVHKCCHTLENCCLLRDKTP